MKTAAIGLAIVLGMFLLLSGRGNVAAQNTKTCDVATTCISVPEYKDGLYVCKFKVCTLVSGDWRELCRYDSAGCGTVIGEYRPVDIPPREWDTVEQFRTEALFPANSYNQHHVECADKSRFKMQSEDGKWHCLKLSQ